MPDVATVFSATDEMMPSVEREIVATYNEIAEELIGEPATGRTLYKAQMKMLRMMKNLISQGIIMPNTATTTISATDNIWKIFVNDNTTASNITSNVTATCGPTTIAWSDWNERYVVNNGRVLFFEEINENERAKRIAHAEALQKELNLKEEKRVAAEVKAEMLLNYCLTAEQRDDLAKNNHFHLYTGNHKYRIERGVSGNVKLINDNDDKPKHQYCIHPVGVPVADVMLAQKLLLETNEQEFLRIANKHW